MSNRLDFSGEVAFVTGAGGGIGRAAALAFAREGASVVVADISEPGAQETAHMIEAAGGQSLAVACDVTREEEVKAALDRTIETFGRLDAAFNNAGIEQQGAAVADISLPDWERVIAVNLRGVFLCLKYEIPLMLERGGAIVNTSSGAGFRGFAGGAAYNASKHAILGLSKTAALDYAAQNIRVNAVCPGIVDTPMMDRFGGNTPEGKAQELANAAAVQPIGRAGRAEEIAAAVLWLCSDAASFITGSAMVVDGGQTV